uniref:HCLS1-associated protein X-1 n=2 Tax=Cuerna arida TaxID=1464854 RepID=A0A1B6G0Q2_9HEMI
MRDPNPFFDIRITSDPEEMHRFFEKQVNDVFRMFSFGFPGLFGPDSFSFSNTVPAIEENKSPRDHYLKPGVNKPQPNDGTVEKDPSKRSEVLDPVVPTNPLRDNFTQPRIYSSFRSVVRKTVTLPDGTVKTEEVIRNSDGTEERRESHTKSDGLDVTFFDVPAVKPRGFFGNLNTPEQHEKSSKDEFLKFGYEKLNPHDEKVDKDLDKQILQSGVEILPSFPKEPEPKQNFSFKSITRRKITMPNGVVQTEEIVRNPDGTEQRTVTQTLPDVTIPSPELGDNGAGSNSGKKEVPQVVQSFTLQGVKDLIGLFFK